MSLPRGSGLRACFVGATWTAVVTAASPALLSAPVEPPQPSSISPQTVPISATTPAEEVEVDVRLKDGQRFTAVLVKAEDDALVLRIGGVETRYLLGMIDRYDVLPPVFDRYRELRAAIGDNPDEILKLADWLRIRGRYELALSEVARVLDLEPANPEAKKAKELLEQLIVLRSKAAPGKPDADPRPSHKPEEPAGGEGDPARSGSRPRNVPFPLLSQEQVNLMRVYEVNLADGPNIRIQRQTIERLLDENAGHPLIPVTREGREAMMRKSPAEILDLMFRVQARNLYGEVQVLDQPAAIAMFRDHVQREWLVNACATAQCHGGSEAGRLMLFNRKPNSDQSVYTNLLILDRFRLSDGSPLIEWEAPERSPLLQMAIPRNESFRPHPEVPRGVTGKDAWRPAIKSRDDRAFARSVDWIRAMYLPRPVYPIDYRAPGASEPAPRPAGASPSAQLPTNRPLPTPSQPPAPGPAPVTPPDSANPPPSTPEPPRR